MAKAVDSFSAAKRALSRPQQSQLWLVTLSGSGTQTTSRRASSEESRPGQEILRWILAVTGVPGPTRCLETPACHSERVNGEQCAAARHERRVSTTRRRCFAGTSPQRTSNRRPAQHDSDRVSCTGASCRAGWVTQNDIRSPTYIWNSCLGLKPLDKRRLSVYTMFAVCLESRDADLRIGYNTVSLPRQHERHWRLIPNKRSRQT
jgi:hypothetical protein